MKDEELAELTRKISALKAWLGSGSINIFGLPMSGKDTVGIRFAEDLGAKFLSSGLIIRAAEEKSGQDLTGEGKLIPTNIFYDLVLPYFELKELEGQPLILSSIGRWSGEENQVLSIAARSGHPIKAAVLLNISEAVVTARWKDAKFIGDRGQRADDFSMETFSTRLAEFRTKTAPVLQHYRELELLTEVPADASRDQVYLNFVNALLAFAGIEFV